MAPSIAPVVSSAIGSFGVSAATSSTVGAVLAPAIAKAAISTALSAAVEDDYSHFGKNITKSLATNVITAAASLASISEPPSSLTDAIKQPVIDAAKGAMESIVRGENILKGTFISVASGAVSGKCLEALPNEVKEVSTVQAAVSTVVSSAVSAMVKKEKDKSLMDSLHEGAETFIINQVGEAAARAVDGLTVEKKKDIEKKKGDEFAANTDRQRQQETSARKNVEKQKAAEPKQTEQTKTNKPKPVQGKKVTAEQGKSVFSSKLRAEDQQKSSNPSSSSTTSLSKISRAAPSTLLQSDEQAAHRRANNLRWLEKSELFSGGLVSFPKLRADTSSRLSLAKDPSVLDQFQSFLTKSIYNNDLAISPKQQQKLKSNPSCMNSIPSLLFGQMAYADGLPQSSDGASSSNSTPQQESIWSVLEKARGGDPNAQLEMRRRVPVGAAFSDAVDSSYRAWNDPILGFKNNVHNRLGASWFLPGSMDDLGEVCLNSVAAMAGVSTVPKVFEGYRKVQFAYQSYKVTQIFRNRLPSDRIQHEAAKTLYRQNMEKPAIQDPKLAKHVDWLYKKDSTLGSGSTADAARLEKLTGNTFKDCSHIEKSLNSMDFLKNWLKNNPKATVSDRAAAENILIDLKDGIGKKPWYSQTKPPKP